MDVEDTKLKQQIEQLTNKIQSLTQTNKILKQKYIESHQKSIRYDRVKTRINTCVNSILFCVSFLQYLGQTSCVYGSLVRKWMECTLHFNTMDSKNTIGDVSNSNINILLHYSDNVNKVFATSQFYQLLHHINTSRIYSEQTHSGIQPPTFYKYRLVGIEHITFVAEDGETIPKANCYFKYGNEFLTVELVAWKTKDIVDFTVNNYILTTNGLQAIFGQSFFQYVEHIHFNQANYIQRLDVIQKNAFPSGTALTRKDKLTHLTKCYHLISHCYLKLYASNYNLIQFMCIKIEQNEDCSITGCKPPYPVVSLECGHSISLMAYKGILFVSSDTDTQAIRCPICRHDLKIKFKPQVIERSLQYIPLSQQFISSTHTLFLHNTLPYYSFINKDASENL